MPERAHIGLDNQAFRGRLRRPVEQPLPSRRPNGFNNRQIVTDYTARGRPAVQPLQRPSAPAIQPPDRPPLPEAAPARINRPEQLEQPEQPTLPILTRPEPPAGLNQPGQQYFVAAAPGAGSRLNPRRYSKLQRTIVGMACLVFVSGLAASWQTLQTNHSAAAQVSALSKRVDKQTTTQSGQLPSTTKPTTQSISQYAVAPDLPRYLEIPKLGVYARVMQVGVTSSGALGTPNNVFDTAWYTGSTKPGQPGATLIDGHVSSWTTDGVFYNIKQLIAGDKIEIERGDGTILNYQVVKTQVYNAGNVDMQAAITPVTAGKPGLNLITCTGQVEKGTSEFNERVIVFAEQL